MFKKIKSAFAKIALVAIVAQMLTTVAPAAVFASVTAPASTVNVLTNINTVNFQTGTSSEFYVNTTNPGSVAYVGALELTITGDVTGSLGTYQYYDVASGAWKNLIASFDGTETLLTDGDDTVNFAAGYDVTDKYRISFKTPGSYEFNIYGAGSSAGGDTFTLSGLSFVKDSAELATLSANLDSRVKKDLDIPFVASIDNTYGLAHNVDATLTIKDAVVADIAKLNIAGTDYLAGLTQSGTDVTATFSGPIAGAAVTNFDIVINFATEKTYQYDFMVMDGVTEIATFASSVIVDGTAPIVTMTSEPVIVNDVKKAIKVTFTGKENILLKSTDIAFSQGILVSKNYSPEVAPVSNKIVVVVPADVFAAGTMAIDVKATFMDTVGNIAPEFAGQIAVDTVAPEAVTGLTAIADASGHVVLTWTNPTTGYTGLKVTRDGAFLTTLPVGTTTFVDTNVVAGTTYKYVVTAYDEAGNETVTLPAEVSLPAAKIAAAVSDSTDYSDTKTSEAAKTADENVAETKGAEDTNEDGLPVWAIALLVVLAIVGGYLIYNQKPAVASAATIATPVTKKSTTSSKKKVASKTKKSNPTKKK